MDVQCRMEVRDGAIHREEFLFDRAELCEQLGVSLARLEEARAALKVGLGA